MRIIEIAVDSPYCDNGCGEKATISLETAGLCDICAENHVRDTLENSGAGRVCGTIYVQSNGYLACCLADSGVEHDHF